ncbi:hypothetical protein M8J77_012906 [Diaphorina citri]|nr:hypothetical protein M8J77_012906 [Diaphorina citri]
MLESPFVIGEYLSAVNLFMKNGKAAGLDDIRTEQIKHFGPVTNKWVLDLMNNCIEADQIPKTWRKTRVVALLKPGKDPNEAKNFRPISLLCHLYKLPHHETKHFIYADDTAVAAQGKTFEEVERKITSSLEKLGDYYNNNHLKPNPSKTEVCAFHLCNNQAKRKLNITWLNQQLAHNFQPRYLGVKLDRSLTFKEHCQNTKHKVISRNNLIRKLTNTRWGAKPHVLRTSALALSVSAAEYAAPVWERSAHAKLVDIAINDTARIISGCLKPTPVDKIYPLLGIAPPEIRRKVGSEIERKKQTEDSCHPLFGQNPAPARLKSRNSFLHKIEPLETDPETRRLALWYEHVLQPILEPKEELSPGAELPYTIWKSLNRLRVGVSRCKQNLARWGFGDTLKMTSANVVQHRMNNIFSTVNN